MSRRIVAAHRLLLALIASATASAAAAQVVINPEQPMQPGGGARWRLELPASWNVDRVTLDPRGVGLSTFVQRLHRLTLDCPASTSCWTGGITLDDRLLPGEQTVPFVAYSGSQARPLAGRVRVAPAIDDDHDGMPDAWERREGLEPWDRLATSAPGDDPDGDLVGNIDEFRNGTTPMGRYRLYFGDASMGDRQRMAPLIQGIQPDRRGGPVRVRFIGDDGRQVIAPDYSEGPEIVGGALQLDTLEAARVLAIEVDSFQPIAAERDLWSGLASHLNATRPAPLSTEWHFATGPSSSPLDVFLLAYNPGDAAVATQFTYYRAAGEAPVTTERVLQPGRTTVWLNADESHLSGRDFAVTVRAAAPILMDRGFRWRAPGRTAPQEQAGPGATALSSQWYFPRVDARRPSAEQIVVANPGERESTIEVAVFRREGEPKVSYVGVGAHARLALRAADFGVESLAAVRLATVNGVPFVAEHAQEGTAADGRWAWSAPGATEVGSTWAMGLPAGGHIALFNPSDEDADVTIEAWYNPTYGTWHQDVTVRVPARRLTLVSLWDDPENPAGPYAGTYLTGQRAAVFSRPRPNGQTGPGIIVGRASRAGALNTPNVRLDPAIATRMR